jgi:hypothetical protein
MVLTAQPNGGFPGRLVAMHEVRTGKRDAGRAHIFTIGVEKYRYGARSAAGSMTALSLTRSAREHRFQMHHCPLQARGPT